MSIFGFLGWARERKSEAAFIPPSSLASPRCVNKHSPIFHFPSSLNFPFFCGGGGKASRFSNNLHSRWASAEVNEGIHHWRGFLSSLCDCFRNLLKPTLSSCLAFEFSAAGTTQASEYSDEQMTLLPLFPLLPLTA